jgi:hypothetical protein
MKNRYFGDVNDYRKYGLLRCIQAVTDFRLLVAWMLTPDDGGADGRRTSYLSQPERWEHFDPVLFRALRDLVSSNRTSRRVDLIEGTSLIPRARCFSDVVPDNREGRWAWSGSLLETASRFDLVFLDPDNGIEVRSRPVGRKGSSKYVLWREITDLWGRGKSLLVYQHFAREKRDRFIRRLSTELRDRTSAPVVVSFATPYVLFLLALQRRHSGWARGVVERVRTSWQDQFKVRDPSDG